MFGFANTLLRNSKYMELPEEIESSTMSGAERARRLADLEVMIRDVKPDSEVGKIALGTKKKNDSKEGERNGKLKRGRLYR